ncbi:MAG: hypothetical protein HOO88_05435 [Kiritimatiellaceae bacterium]|nr:hypothetical protein [Kiritimatiellaceae bacterium]
MRQAEDIVWSTITESAKRRFDYTGFKNHLNGDERVAEYILFQIITGYAEELSLAEFLSKLREELRLFGYSFSSAELDEFLADKKEILNAEIIAAKEALSGFAQGKDAPGLLVQIQRLLR